MRSSFSICRTAAAIRPLRQLPRFVAEQNIAVDRLFTQRWRLDQAEAAYAVFDQQTAGKGVFVMQ